MKRITVLIVDHSAVMRRFLTDVLSSSPRLLVVGTALDAVIAVKKIELHDPDVVTLGMGVPGIDGPALVSGIMKDSPRPVVLIADQAGPGRAAAVKALAEGAIDFITRPAAAEIDTPQALTNFSTTLIDKIIAAGASRIARKPVSITTREPAKHEAGMTVSDAVIAIGASAGGVPVILEILTRSSPRLPAMIIAQHMPGGFTTAFAERANQFSPLRVREAQAGDRLYRGTALIAPGGLNTVLARDHRGISIVLYDEEYQTRYKPSVDLLFASVADAAGPAAVGIILTGMGSDGSRGLLAMRDAGAMTIAQDRESSIVYGMPLKALENGAAKKVMNIEQIVAYLNTLAE